MGEAQGRVTCDGTLPIEDPCDTVGRDLELARERGGAQMEGFEFFGQVLSRVDSGQCHYDSPSDSLLSQR
jgi:hypothetical protein